MQCNIDQRGRKARLVLGAVVAVVGSVTIVTGICIHHLGGIVAGVVVSVAGMFMIFEGIKGWCALRAMGFRTRL